MRKLTVKLTKQNPQSTFKVQEHKHVCGRLAATTSQKNDTHAHNHRTVSMNT